MTAASSDIFALILAGGQGKRLQQPSKPLARLGDRRLIDYVVAAARAQCAMVALNLHDDAPETLGPFADLGLETISDALPGRLGPLAGVLGGLDFAAAQCPDVSHILSLPCDCPFLPKNLAARLRAAGDFCCAASGGKTHPVIALWPVRLRHDLREALKNGELAVGRFQARHGVRVVEWNAEPDPFFNVNRPEDVLRAKTLLEGTP